MIVPNFADFLSQNLLVNLLLMFLLTAKEYHLQLYESQQVDGLFSIVSFRFRLNLSLELQAFSSCARYYARFSLK